MCVKKSLCNIYSSYPQIAMSRNRLCYNQSSTQGEKHADGTTNTGALTYRVSSGS